MMSNTPLELRYTASHEWIKVEDGIATVGITEHAQGLLGDIVFIELPELGDEVRSQQEIGVVESVKAASDFYAPIDGEVVEVNEALVDNPGLVNTDSFGDGWLVKLSISDDNQLTELLDSEQYAQTINEE